MKFPSPAWVSDAVERVLMTGLVAAFGAWSAAPSFDRPVIAAATTIGVAAGVTLAKTILTGLLTGTGSLAAKAAAPAYEATASTV